MFKLRMSELISELGLTLTIMKKFEQIKLLNMNYTFNNRERLELSFSFFMSSYMSFHVSLFFKFFIANRALVGLFFLVYM